MSNFEHGAVFAENFLEHFGVKGMRWGVRRDGSASAGKSKKNEGETSDDSRTATELATKVKAGGTKALSNKELRTLVERMNLEQNYARISTPAAKKQNPILAGTLWTARKAVTLTGQSMEQVIKANLANEMNARVRMQLNKPKSS